jgi:CheY-like chemotaxis protein/HPt (histidine-containing phosphotransfer) domain-containing protein
VILTSAGVRGDAQRLNQLGFAGYFGKPIPPENLQDALRAVMATRGMDEQERQRSGLVTKYTLSGMRRNLTRLLLVEDSDVNREIMLKMLSKLGYTADIAENGGAAIQAATREEYGLILMDLHLPDISGTEAIEAIRALPGAHAKVKIAVLTAGASDKEITRCRALGVSDFLTKPLDSSVLADALKRYQIIPTSAMENVSPPDALAAALPEAKATVPDAKLVEIFVKEATQRLESLRDALAFDDVRRAAREAHTLKSSSTYFQDGDMRDAAAQLEEMADKGQLGQAGPVLQKLEEAYTRLRDSLTKNKN